MTAGTVTAAQRQRVQEAQDNKLFATQCKNWCENVSKAVSRTLFRRCQFMNDDESQAVGSHWMKLVCDSVGIPEEKREAFWERYSFGGKKAARNALRKRRTNVTNAMKKVFSGKVHYIRKMVCGLL
jgi:hypothetical protein